MITWHLIVTLLPPIDHRRNGNGARMMQAQAQAQAHVSSLVLMPRVTSLLD
jgi:hypothetical protein